MADLSFDKLPDSKELTFVKTGGIHTGFRLDSAEYMDGSEKKKDEKKEEEAKEGDVKKKSNPYVKLVFKNDKEQFTAMIFAPPVKVEDVKFCADKYENGTKIGKRTPEEQIVGEFNDRFYIFEQLARAFSGSKEKIDSFKAQAKGEPDTLFKVMFDKFFTIFTKDFYKEKKINFKALFSNNDKAKTSFLGLAKAQANNMIFAPFTTDDNSGLQLSDYEETLVKRKYSPRDRAPKGNAAEVAGDNWQPVQETEDGKVIEKDLF